MRITSYSIEKLFGTFSYSFSFKEFGDVVVLTGPNGYGKTTLLRILFELSRNNIYYFYLLSFDEIVLRFDNGQYLIVSSSYEVLEDGKSNKKDLIVSTEKKHIYFLWGCNDKVLVSFDFSEQDRSQLYLNFIAYKRIGVEYSHTAEAMLSYLSENLSVYRTVLGYNKKFADLTVYLGQINVLYIPSDRIYEFSKPNIHSIENISESIKFILGEYHKRYLQRLSQSRTRMIDILLEHRMSITMSKYNQIRDSLTPKIANLYRWGLIDFNSIKPYDKENDSILTVYIEEIQNTISVYDDLYEKLMLFSSILSGKGFINKTIMPRNEKGIDVRLHDNTSISIALLSSGEQNEILLLYKLIFESRKDSVILIDEPEISLHLSWIRDQLNDYVKISKMIGIQCLITTHSAAFINGSWDKTYDLFENDSACELR